MHDLVHSAKDSICRLGDELPLPALINAMKRNIAAVAEENKWKPLEYVIFACLPVRL